MMGDIRLTLAIGDYEHVRDLATGRVKPEGIELTVLMCNIEEIIHRFLDRLEWEVSEMSMGNLASYLSRDDRRMVALPIFPSRVFRQSAFFVRTDGPVRRPEDLAGRRIGVPQWSQTATVYARGWLNHQIGIPLNRIEWLQAGVNAPGRVETAVLRLPEGLSLRSVPDRTLPELLVAGEIDAIISARPPDAFLAGDPRIGRLFPNYREVEEAYFRETGIFPIMHGVVLRRDVFEAKPWVARNLCLAFEEAKRRSLARILDKTVSSIPLPWLPEYAETVGRDLVFGGGDLWPYGVEANRKTLDAFLQYCFEQGVAHRRITTDELFPKEARAAIVV